MHTSSKVGIIGGGVSGLYFAWLCHENKIPFTLLESTPRLGGALETSCNKNGVIELGAHTLYNTYEECLRWIEVLGLKICNKSSLPYRLKFGNEYQSFFKSFHWMEALGNMGAWWQWRRLKNKPLSIQEKFSVLFGKRNCQELIFPFFNALLNQDAEAFPADWVFKKRKKNKRYPRKFTLEGGLSTLVETVESKIKESVYLNSTPKNIAEKDGVYFLQTHAQSFAFSHLVLATPLDQTASYLKTILPHLSPYLEGFCSVQTLSVAVDSVRSPRFPVMSGAIAKDAPFRSFITNDTQKNSEDMRSCVFHFKNPTEPFPLETIQKALFLTEQKDIFVRQKKINTMPKITVENKKQIEILMEEIQKNATLFLCGNAYGGCGIEDCLMRSKKEFERFSRSLIKP